MEPDRCPCGAYAVSRGRCYPHLHHDPRHDPRLDPPAPRTTSDGYDPGFLPQPPVTVDELAAGLTRLGIPPHQATRAARHTIERLAR